MRGAAEISPCGVYRYNLIRVWDEEAPRICFVLLNPSTADGKIDDNTLRRGIGFAKAWGYGSVEFVNLYAFRATDPSVLRRAAENMDVIGPENDNWIAEAARRAEKVVLAWGANKVLPVRPGVVIALLKSCGHKLWCLGKTQEGHPKHPLRLAKTTPLEPWEGNGKMELPSKVSAAVSKAMEDRSAETVGRRVVMRKVALEHIEQCVECNDLADHTQMAVRCAEGRRLMELAEASRVEA